MLPNSIATPIYSRDDLDAWAKARLGKLVHSTSELDNWET
jgi:hypothetical protein